MDSKAKETGGLVAVGCLTSSWKSGRSELQKRPQAMPAVVSAIEAGIARCVNNYGDSGGQDARLLMSEWMDQLGHYGPELISHAVREHLRRSKWFPRVSELIELIEKRLPDPEPPPGLPLWKADVGDFARNGRSEAEEIAHRKAVIAKAWADARRDNPEVVEAPAGGLASDAPRASQSMVVSDALKHSCAARRARGERTCGDDEGWVCLRTGIGVRKCKIDRELGL